MAKIRKPRRRIADSGPYKGAVKALKEVHSLGGVKLTTKQTDQLIKDYIKGDKTAAWKMKEVRKFARGSGWRDEVLSKAFYKKLYTQHRREVNLKASINRGAMLQKY